MKAAVSAVVAGEVDGGILATPGMLPFVASGKVIALAVTSNRRSALVPLRRNDLAIGFSAVMHAS